MQIIDADGHVNDRACADEIARYMPKGNQTTQIFPALDHFHLTRMYCLMQNGEAPRTGNPDAKEWVDFLDKTGIAWTVLYPSGGLAVGRIVSWEWAVAACQAYNNWLYEKFLNNSSRIKGMALIPIQNVDRALDELRRAVKELGMMGAMLPSNGEGLKAHLGSEIYWPIYEEAEKLGCALAVHGGCHHHFGMDTFSTYYPVHALGHPIGVMVQAAAMLSHGIFDQFPGIRVAFLEGGASWVPFLIDRIDRSYESHLQVDLEGNLLVGPKPQEKASEHFMRHIQDGRIFVGFDCDEKGLGYAVRVTGREPFLYASDFPHEGFNAEIVRREIDELLSREDLTETDKQAALGQNARRFYRYVG
jgi:predicted TIM-barrel fold metal-dependent hydrolase